MTTKQRIIYSALTLLAEKGYDAVSVSEIAEAVGIKAPSLYKHFPSKQDIFHAILAEMKGRYEQQTAQMQMNGLDAHADLERLALLSENQLIEMGKELFLFFLRDEYVCKFRKMLTVEQYRNSELAALYSKQYVDDPLVYQSMLFGLLAQAGVFRGESPQIMAVHFYAPIYMLLTLCDRQPEREQEMLQLVEQHVKQFSKLYKNGGNAK
ncbi:TetR/AcrR family transcriptional regulator [Paenibacillus brevis]|uniref:TetR/AcrR family transcriptional regulator n=1 Tax=Paenibacillus brevis TaxID=2841508 RepID=A0ABS6FSQ5_9BACL|nr:TetR/AcrR family transcriptional regulator [Paenibacillus brevis]MBU5673154.1 TetR/AcrR family transcriptional regulator [Paenibacillus brevis]